jgi:hypothetical protein
VTQELRPTRLFPIAAHAGWVDDINVIVNELDAGYVSHRFLNKLLQIKRRKPAAEVQATAVLSNGDAAATAAKMRV